MPREKLRFASVAEGDAVPRFAVENVSRVDFVRYAGASSDFNAIHYDETFAKSAGYPTVFAQGMFTAGLLAKCVTDYVGRPNLRAYRVSFRAQVWSGDTITCAGKVTKKLQAGGENRIEGEVTATNQKGETVVQGRSEEHTSELQSR